MPGKFRDNHRSIFIILVFFAIWGVPHLPADEANIPIYGLQENLLGYLYVGANESSGIEVEPLSEEISQSLKIKAQVGKITAVFSHEGEDILEALKAMGGSHFNWVNIVTNGENALFPTLPGSRKVPPVWVDPLPGGNQGKGIFPLEDDRRPFFWSEEEDLARGVFVEIDKFNIGNRSIFTDFPNNRRNSTVSFETYLVAVLAKASKKKEAREFLVFAGFSWESHIDSRGNPRVKEVTPIVLDDQNAPLIGQKINQALASCLSFKKWKANVQAISKNSEMLINRDEFLVMTAEDDPQAMTK